MAISKETQEKFIKEIAPIIVNYAKEYGYKYPSAIICQAIHESAYGTSSLGYKYHNYFGMKCGSAWKGSSVNLKTQEEYTVGTLTTIRDNFRAYPNMAEGVKGYFQFISASRYKNLKMATSCLDYIQKIVSDGYATGSKYVVNCNKYYSIHDLGKYDIEDGYCKAYYPKWENGGSSIVNGLIAVGEKDTSLSHRKEIYFVNFGDRNYTGTAEQNLKMVQYLKSGILYKV